MSTTKFNSAISEIEDLIADYDYSITDYDYDDPEMANRYITVQADNGSDITIWFENLNLDDVKTSFLKLFRQALHDFDPADTAVECGFVNNEDEYNFIINLTDDQEMMERTANQIDQDLAGASESHDRFAEAMMEYLNNLAMSVKYDGYQHNNLALLEAYSRSMADISNCRPMYEAIKTNVANPHDVDFQSLK